MTVFNEFVKVHNEPQSVLLGARMHRKQQQSKFEILQISNGSCTVSWFMLMICEECKQYHIMGLMHHIF